MSVNYVANRSRNLAPRTDLSNRRVLLMVRDRAAALPYERMFELFGAQTISVSSATELLAQLRTQHPDAVVCDLDAPDVDLNVVRRIRMRSRLDGGATPALAMTSALAATMHTKALLAGFQAYASSEPLELVMAVARMLGVRTDPN